MPADRLPLKQWTTGSYDLIVIGGGINGAGIARDAALRGFGVALVDQADFGFGTSSRSSKLIHGGIRYLEQGRLPLVFESSRERRILEHVAPHLVRPLPFLFPVYKGARWGRFLLNAGMWLYDLLALFQNGRGHRMLGPEETLRLEPGLLAEGLTGAALYYDAQMDDARLCLANILEARSAGASVRNYTKVTELSRGPDGRVNGVRVRDRLTGEEAWITGRRVVNAAGPWVDEIARMEAPSEGPRLRRTRGSHLILPALTRRHAMVIRSRKDGRVIFVIPWEGNSLVGTTDVDDPGDPGEVRCPPEDRDYLLGEVRRYFPEARTGPGDAIAAFAGVRPLIYSNEAPASEVSREEKIETGPLGMITLTGGKFTTYRHIAERIVNRIQKGFPGRSIRPCTTRSRPLWGGDLENLQEYIETKKPDLAKRYSLDSHQAAHLISAHGTRHERVLALLGKNPALGERLLPDLPHLKAEVVFAVREESALTLSDVLRRRTTIALGPHRANETLISATADLMAAELGWTESERSRQRTEYLGELDTLA